MRTREEISDALRRCNIARIQVSPRNTDKLCPITSGNGTAVCPECTFPDTLWWVIGDPKMAERVDDSRSDLIVYSERGEL